MFPPELAGVLAGFENKGYTIFRDPSNKGYNLNIVGVRSREDAAGAFDDWVLCFYELDGSWQYQAMKATTDPGSFYLKNPINPKGTAILKPGQYRGLWQIGKHRGQYDALVQVRPCTVFRDNNRDNILDTCGDTPQETGMFGINLHRSLKTGFGREVGRHSAGCQVICLDLDFNALMHLCHRAARIWGNSFTYTLLEEKDIAWQP